MTKIIDKFLSEVDITEHLWITMPDGCRLAAKIWLPVSAAQQPVPTILEYIPYRKADGTANRDQVIARGKWETRTESNLAVSCLHQCFFVEAKLTAYENDIEAFSRSWATEIPRDGF
ncbi:MAG TPA: CocE/NonD family hydrolase [Arenicellales bacterium]|nr:CocE/NonD family hydrolase [Arenicellales bacterium]